MSKVKYEGEYRGEDILLENLRSRVLDKCEGNHKDPKWGIIWDYEADAYASELLSNGEVKSSNHVLNLKYN